MTMGIISTLVSDINSSLGLLLSSSRYEGKRILGLVEMVKKENSNISYPSITNGSDYVVVDPDDSYPLTIFHVKTQDSEIREDKVLSNYIRVSDFISLVCLFKKTCLLSLEDLSFLLLEAISKPLDKQFREKTKVRGATISITSMSTDKKSILERYFGRSSSISADLGGIEINYKVSVLKKANCMVELC